METPNEQNFLSKSARRYCKQENDGAGEQSRTSHTDGNIQQPSALPSPILAAMKLQFPGANVPNSEVGKHACGPFLFNEQVSGDKTGKSIIDSDSKDAEIKCHSFQQSVASVDEQLDTICNPRANESYSAPCQPSKPAAVGRTTSKMRRERHAAQSRRSYYKTKQKMHELETRSIGMRLENARVRKENVALEQLVNSAICIVQHDPTADPHLAPAAPTPNQTAFLLPTSSGCSIQPQNNKSASIPKAVRNLTSPQTIMPPCIAPTGNNIPGALVNVQPSSNPIAVTNGNVAGVGLDYCALVQILEAALRGRSASSAGDYIPPNAEEPGGAAPVASPGLYPPSPQPLSLALQGQNTCHQQDSSSGVATADPPYFGQQIDSHKADKDWNTKVRVLLESIVQIRTVPPSVIVQLLESMLVTFLGRATVQSLVVQSCGDSNCKPSRGAEYGSSVMVNPTSDFLRQPKISQEDLFHYLLCLDLVLKSIQPAPESG